MEKRRKIFIEFVILLIIAGGILVFIYQDQIFKSKEFSIEDFFEFKIDEGCELNDYMKQRVTTTFNNAKAALIENNEDFSALRDLGSLKMDICDYKGARNIYLYMAEKWPESSIPFINLGSIYSKHILDPIKAEEMYLKAIDNNPGIISNYRNLYDLYIKFLPEKKNIADDILIKGFKKNPKNTEFLVLLGDHYADIEYNKDKAVEYYNKYLEINPNDNTVRKRIEKLQTIK